jgi:hypothetical protein
MQRYLQDSQDKVFKNVTNLKDETMQKVYGDLQRASDTERSVYLYHQRNKDLSALQDQVYKSQKNNADAVINDRDLAKRQFEINQWSFGNKMDTLFIYSQLFIILCTFIVLLFIWHIGILSASVVFIFILILLLIFTFTIVNRTQYTNDLRDERYWNRRKFPTYKPVPKPDLCNMDINKEVEKAKEFGQSAYSSALSGISGGLSSLSGMLNTASKSTATLASSAAPVAAPSAPKA